MILRILLLSVLSVAPLAAKSKDLTLIRQLPKRLTELKVEGHKKWDTGATFVMLEGCDEFNRELIKILKELVRTYAVKDFLKESDVDVYVRTLLKKLEFEKKLGNPRGEDKGTLAYLEIPSGLSSELRDAIRTTVWGISEYEASLDFEAWSKEWEKASIHGD